MRVADDYYAAFRYASRSSATAPYGYPERPRAAMIRIQVRCAPRYQISTLAILTLNVHVPVTT